MKNYLLHIIMFTFVVACLSGLTGKIAAEGIRIVPPIGHREERQLASLAGDGFEQRTC